MTIIFDFHNYTTGTDDFHYLDLIKGMSIRDRELISLLLNKKTAWLFNHTVF